MVENLTLIVLFGIGSSEAYTEYFFSNGSRKNIYDEADRPSILFDNESDSPQKTIGHVLAFT